MVIMTSHRRLKLRCAQRQIRPARLQLIFGRESADLRRPNRRPGLNLRYGGILF